MLLALEGQCRPRTWAPASDTLQARAWGLALCSRVTENSGNRNKVPFKGQLYDCDLGDRANNKPVVERTKVTVGPPRNCNVGLGGPLPGRFAAGAGRIKPL